MIAEALDLPSTALLPFFDTPQQHKLKLIEYPAPQISSSDAAAAADHGKNTDVQGVGPHQDSGFLTFLKQATPHAGLEVQNKSGAWIPAPPIPETLVINIGRSLEVLTRGVCTATTHRVNLRPENFLHPETKEPLGPRFSFPVFQGVGIELSAKQLEGLDIPLHIARLADDENHRGVRSDAEATFNNTFRGHVGEGTFVARVTSHQDVGRRWYPDLLDKALSEQKKFKGH